MTEHRAEYQEQRILRAQQRAVHRLTAPPDCKCPDCRTTDELIARTRGRLEAQAQANGEPPF